MATPVLRPRCWSGKNNTCEAPRSPKAHESTALALDDVQTAPPLRPTKALRAAEEFMYVMGTTRDRSVTRARSSHASSTDSMSAMSAIEQPALRSGSTTRWDGDVSTSADSAMKCTPQKTTYSASVPAAMRDSPKESPRASAHRIT